MLWPRNRERLDSGSQRTAAATLGAVGARTGAASVDRQQPSVVGPVAVDHERSRPRGAGPPTLG
jgi:hypothetical protein